MTFNLDADVDFVSTIDDEVKVKVNADADVDEDDDDGGVVDVDDDNSIIVGLLLVGITTLSPPLFVVVGCLFTTIPGVGRWNLELPDDKCCCCCGFLDKLGSSVFCKRGKIISAAFFMVAAAAASAAS
jgi:hypothetical protein